MLKAIATPDIEPLVRVVAILAQGILSRRPTRRADTTSIARELTLVCWVSRGRNIFIVTALTPKQDKKVFYFYPRTELRREQWFKDTNLMPNLIDQVEAERLASVAMTFPYAVERVDDTAIALAKDLINKCVADNLALRKKEWGEE